MVIPVVARPGEAGALTLEGCYEDYLSIAGPTWVNEVDADVSFELGSRAAVKAAKELDHHVLVQIAGVAFFIWNVVHSLRKGRVAGPDPWDAWTLEWSTASPPPEYNFEEIPDVYSRRPLWDIKHPDDPDWKYE